MMAFWGLLIPLLGVVGVGLGYPMGAPTSVCFTMRPLHRGTTPMSTESPYSVEVQVSTVAPGGIVTVSITGTEGFRGFLLQARRTDSSSDLSVVGMFPDRGHGADLQPLACGGQAKSALTHTDRSIKKIVMASWRAPEEDVDGVQFIATVVRSFDEYWVGIRSPEVTVRRPSTVSSTNPPTGITEDAPSTARAATTFLETTPALSTADPNPSTTGDYGQGTEPASASSETNRTNSSGVTSVTYSSVTEKPFVSTTPPNEDSNISSPTTPRVASPLPTTNSTTPTERLENVTEQAATNATESASLPQSTLTTSHFVTPLSTPTSRESTTPPAVKVTPPFNMTTAILTPETNTSTGQLSTTSSVTETHSQLGSITDDTMSTPEMSTTPNDNGTPSDATELSTTNSVYFENETVTEVPDDTNASASNFSSSTTLLVSNTTNPETVNLTVTTQLYSSQTPPVNTSEPSTSVPETSEDHSTTKSPFSETTRPLYSSSTATEFRPSTPNQYDDGSTTPLAAASTTPVLQSTPPGLSTTIPVVESKTPLITVPTTFLDNSTLMGSSTAPSGNSSRAPFVESSTLVESSTTLSVNTSTNPAVNTTTTSTDTFTNMYNITTLGAPSTQPPVDASTVIFNVSSTPEFNMSYSKPYSDSYTDTVTRAEMPTATSTENPPLISSTSPALQSPTREITKDLTKPTTYPPTSHPSTTVSSVTTSTMDGERTVSTTDFTFSSTSASTGESTSESTTMSTATSVSTSESTSESTKSSTDSPTNPTQTIAVTQTQNNPAMTTAYVVTEQPNELRMRIRITSIIFTEDLKDPNSESFRRMARQVEQVILDLYGRNDVTTVASVKVLRFIQGSIIPEVQILATEPFDNSTKSAWLNVMYNEVHDEGRLGNFSVSDVSAVTSDGTFAEVDPCFLLPCPASMVCFVYQGTCFSACYLNANYCLNNGICEEPSGNRQLVSCRCDMNHEGNRCEVRKDPVTPSEEDNQQVLIAALWGSIGTACLVIIVICTAWLIRNRRRKQRWRHTAQLMGRTEPGREPPSRGRMDSYARRLTSIRAGVLIDLANISVSGSEGENMDAERISRSASVSDVESLDQPRFIDGGVHIGGMPDILQGASTTDYELDVMNRPLNPRRKSVSFNDVTEMIDFVATENFTLGNKEDSNGNFQVRWDFQVDRSDSRESGS